MISFSLTTENDSLGHTGEIMDGEIDKKKSAGILYVVATPIGNLDDLTFRALKTLECVQIIACEDTRQTKKILNAYNIKNKLSSYYQPREKQKIPLIINRLLKGEDVALVSDAGTPGLSDPGFPLIKEAIDLGIKIVPIPGPSALTAALSAAGLPTHRFLFLGFPPPKREATKKLLRSLKEEASTLIFYLPPRKFPSFLSVIHEILGERQVVIAREMSKIHEEFIRGTAKELTLSLKEISLKGEATILIGPPKKQKNQR
jgi:16S rRNA (cytidine1402-2'-O)-methyltransferase